MWEYNNQRQNRQCFYKKDYVKNLYRIPKSPPITSLPQILNVLVYSPLVFHCRLSLVRAQCQLPSSQEPQLQLSIMHISRPELILQFPTVFLDITDHAPQIYLSSYVLRHPASPLLGCGLTPRYSHSFTINKLHSSCVLLHGKNRGKIFIGESSISCGSTHR